MSTLLLVPTPLRAARAARRLCDAEGGVLLGARVATPEALLPALLAAAGDPRTLLSPLGVRLLALESAGPPGAPLAGADPAGGLARAWAAALAELRRGEVTADVAAAAAASLGGRPGERLAALAAALRRYQQRLEDLGALDRPAALRAAASAVRRGAAAEATGSLDLLAVDGFGAPSAGEWDLFAALAGRARRAHVRAPALAERPDLFAGAEPLLRRAEGLGAGSAETSLSLGRAEAREPRLGRMLLALAGGPGGGPAGDGGRLRLAAGAGEEGEAEVAARLAAGLLEGGLAPEDVLLFAPATARAAPLLARAFADRGVPLACGAAGSLAEAPPVRAVRAALAAGAAPGEEAAAAATSYLDPGRSGELLRPFGRPATAAAQAAALAALLSAGGVRRRAARGEAARAARDLAALDRLEETAEDLARARALLGRGADRLEPAAWLSSLDCALAAAAAPPAAEPASGAVELWPLAEAPGLEARAAIVLSCARGRFPAPPPPEPLLREPERAAVNRLLRRGALATASARRADALLAAAGALAAGRELVACTWAASGPEGPGEAPAPLAAEAAALAGSDPEPPAAGPALGEARAA
ncbi:MAG TPA: PD-(D/E)XK nuclease family protein, partial [Anaeromyxobacteraceae bacterium]